MPVETVLENFDVYQVGGSVRDSLMGCVEKDRDWVVVGATPDDMLTSGFLQVGKDFPVFLHPQTKEEYALARCSRRDGEGREFDGVVYHRDATIEDDLAHRDFTINALAMTKDGRLVDPFGGRSDIQNRVIRHVGSAFNEDPLRVLRGARFAAVYPDFTIADDTLDMFRQLGTDGKLVDLQPERVWAELVKALRASAPWRFIETLRACEALVHILPELDVLFGVPQPEEHHPEIDTGAHILLCMKRVQMMTDDTATRFAVLVHDLGKGVTPQHQWPRHIGHEEAGVGMINDLAKRLRMPNNHRDFGALAARWHTHVHRADDLRPGTMLKLLEAVDAFKRPERLESLLVACEADSTGRKGYEDRAYPQADIVRTAYDAAKKITAKQLLAEGYDAGAKLKGILDQRRVEAMKSVLPSSK